MTTPHREDGLQDVDVAALQTALRARGVEPHYPPGRC